MGNIPTTAVWQRTQVGSETAGAWGTKVAATKALGSVMVTATPKIETDAFAARGALLPTVMIYGAETTNLQAEGRATYEEIGEFITSIASTKAANVPSKTIEIGDPADAAGQIYAGCVITGWTLKGNQKTIDLSASLIGKFLDNSAALTAALDIPSQTPLENDHMTIKIATVEIANCISWELSASDLWALAYFVGDKAAGGATQKPISAKLNLVVEANSTNIARLTDRASKALEVKAVSGAKSVTITMNGQLDGDIGSLEANGEVYAYTLPYRIMHKSTGNSINVAVV